MQRISWPDDYSSVYAGTTTLSALISFKVYHDAETALLDRWIKYQGDKVSPILSLESIADFRKDLKILQFSYICQYRVLVLSAEVVAIIVFRNFSEKRTFFGGFYQ